MKEKDRPEIIPGNFPFPLSKGKGESKYLTWLRNHSDYMATRGFLDYMRAIGVLIRGILVNFLAVLPSLLVLSVFIAWFFKPFFDQRKPITNLHGDTLVYTLEQTGPKKLEQGGDAIINPLTRKYWFTRSGPDYAKLNVSIVKPNEEAQESLNIDPESERTKGRGIFVVEEAELLYQDPAGKGPFRIGKLIKNSSDELEIEFSPDVTPDVITDLVHSIAFENKSSTVIEELRDVEFTLMGADSQKKKWKATVTVDRIGRLMELPADDGESSVSLVGIFKKVGDIARGIRDGFGHDPFSLTSLVLVLSTALVLLFPVGSRLCRIVGYRKIKETGKGSSVKQRDKVERMFGGALLAILIAIMIGVLPWLIDEYHRINVRDGQGYLMFAGIIAILLIANKMLAGLSGAKKVLMMALVAIAGMLAPFLVVVNTTRFLAYSNTTPGAKWFLLIVIPVVFLVAIGLAGLLGVCKRSITFSGFFIKLPLIAAGIIGATVLFPILGIILFTGMKSAI